MNTVTQTILSVLYILLCTVNYIFKT